MPPRDLVLLATLALLMLGAIIVQSAGMTVTQPGTTADLATNRAVLLALAAGAAFWVGRQTPTRWLHSPVVAIAAIGVAILLLAVVLLPGIGARVNGARRWIDLGPIGFQPSEIAKWAMILFMAWFASSRRGTLAEFKSGLGPALIVVALVCGLTIIEDLGTAVLIGAVAALLLLSAGARIAHFAIIALPAIGVLATAVVLEPYRLQRLQTFINPWADPADSGYHVIQSLKAIRAPRGAEDSGTGFRNSAICLRTRPTSSLPSSPKSLASPGVSSSSRSSHPFSGQAGASFRSRSTRPGNCSPSASSQPSPARRSSTCS